MTLTGELGHGSFGIVYEGVVCEAAPARQNYHVPAAAAIKVKFCNNNYSKIMSIIANFKNLLKSCSCRVYFSRSRKLNIDVDVNNVCYVVVLQPTVNAFLSYCCRWLMSKHHRKKKPSFWLKPCS